MRPWYPLKIWHSYQRHIRNGLYQIQSPLPSTYRLHCVLLVRKVGERWTVPLCVFVPLLLAEKVWIELRLRMHFSETISSFSFTSEIRMLGLNIPSSLKLKGSLLCPREIWISAGQHDELLSVMPFSDLWKHSGLKIKSTQERSEILTIGQSCWEEWNIKDLKIPSFIKAPYWYL